MSWVDMVKNNLVATGKVSKGAICGHDGSIWGISDDFKLEPSEAVSACNAFKNPDAVLGTGLRLEGEKYFVLRADDERVIGKIASKGFFLYKTKQAVIMALYPAGVQPEECSKVAGALADYFKSIQY